MTGECNIHDHITFVPDRPFNDFRYSVDSTRLRELGWVEKNTDFEANLQLLIRQAGAQTTGN